MKLKKNQLENETKKDLSQPVKLMTRAMSMRKAHKKPTKKKP
jgi:hypothetical protein